MKDTTIWMKMNKLKARVSAATAIGGRKDLEDRYSIVYHHPPAKPYVTGSHLSHHHDNVLERPFLFLGIFDGHGGQPAAQYVCQHLCKTIVRQRAFWSNDDHKIKLAIHRGFIRTHKTMLNSVPKWPRSENGYPSTSGTTASIVFIMNGKYYTGHVGDSKIVLGRKEDFNTSWTAHPMTLDHKPECPRELSRIESCGGRVMASRSGIRRVVWNRPRLENPNVLDLVPFLAVARSLGDFWSYHPQTRTFVVSPEPDVNVVEIDSRDKCLILASDGLWNVLSVHRAVQLTHQFEGTLSKEYYFENNTHASTLLNVSLAKWAETRYRADNVTVLTLLFDHQQIMPKNDDDHHPIIMNNFLFPTCYNDDEDKDDDDDLVDYCSDEDMIGSIIHSIDYDTKTEAINAQDDLQIPSSIKRDVSALLESLLNRVCHDEDIYINMSPIATPNESDENELDQRQLAMIDFNRFLDELQNKSSYICEFMLDKRESIEEMESPARTILQPMMNSPNFLNESPAFEYFAYVECNLTLLRESSLSVMDHFSQTSRTMEQLLRTRSLSEIDLKINPCDGKVENVQAEGEVPQTFVRPRTSSYTGDITSTVRLPKICFKRKSYLEQLKTEAGQSKRVCMENGSALDQC